MKILILVLILTFFSSQAGALSWASHDCGQIQAIDPEQLQVVVGQETYFIDSNAAQQTLRTLMVYQRQRQAVCFDLEPGERGLVIQPKSIAQAN